MSPAWASPVKGGENEKYLYISRMYFHSAWTGYSTPRHGEEARAVSTSISPDFYNSAVDSNRLALTE